MNYRLAEQITFLLLRHHYVVVPQLGGFIREVLPASYNAYKAIVYPPSAELHFNQELTHSDGLLEERYALLLGLSLRRARLVLEEEVKQLRHALIQMGTIELPGIGTLQMSASGVVSFVPQPSSPATLGASYGYTSLTLPRLVQEQTTKTAEVVSPVPQGRGDYILLRFSKRALGYAAAVAFVALSLIPWGRGAESERSYQAGFTPTSYSAEQLFGTATLEEKKPEVVDIPQEQGLQYCSEQDNRYHIIIATEPTKERLESYYKQAVSELGTKDIQAYCSRTGKVIRLSVASFDSSDAAYTFLNSFVKEHPSYSTAWVFRNN